MAKRRVLLVDDDKDFAEIVKARLAPTGWEILYISDGSHALKIAREQKPDVILLDIFLPETDGFTTLKTLKSRIDPETKAESTVCNIPTIVMTGKAPMMEEMVRFEGACEFITKPVDFGHLIKKLDQIFAKSSPPAQK